MCRFSPYGDKQKLLLSQDVSQIEKTDSMRRDFVANVSHELKTPLTVLSGFLETVQELELNEEDRKKYLDLMSVQTGRMKTLVEDLLTLAKLEGNPEPPVTQVVPMAVMLSRLQADAQGLSQGRHEIVVENNSQKKCSWRRFRTLFCLRQPGIKCRALYAGWWKYQDSLV
jgi:two-component system, OmpR family, phosphate regulon sensor histidine kinase PhoR